MTCGSQQQGLFLKRKRGQVNNPPTINNNLPGPYTYTSLANAGIPIDVGSLGEVFVHPLTMGVTAGLVLGKFGGILLFSWLAVKSGISRLPDSVSMSQIGGVALLAGIGFTMSIFVAGLAFEGQIDYLDSLY